MTDTADRRYGLALSGGGFRAVLYHLGVIRFLRDAGALSQVTHITSVSGGSVIGAHMALNWDRYCGTESEFNEVSGELLRFLQLDVRNRIVRRFPLASAVNTARRTMRLETWRQYTRAGLLEQHYEKFLYGDIGLFDLPDSPHLYVLATNLNEGSLCAFHREGLLLHKRSRCGRQVGFEEHELGMATVPMAVAASSAFPGFFPPLELRSKDVGSREGEFDRHAFTDGGIYDNVGLRMFRHLQQDFLRQTEKDSTVELVDAVGLAESVRAAASMREGSPQRELSRHLLEQSTASLKSTGGPNATDGGAGADSLLRALDRVSRQEQLYRRPEFQSLSLNDARAEQRLNHIVATGEEPDQEERIWLNCELASAALREVTGSVCIESRRGFLDGVFVSDAGASFKVRSDGRAGGLLSTALRSTDILMDRVNQMELESFSETQGVMFLPITRLVRAEHDPTAPHPEIQRQAGLIRTDMDRFSDLEISSLVQHGYSVARQVFRENPVIVGTQSGPQGRPWDPLQCAEDIGRNSKIDLGDRRQVLRSARTLQRSSSRRTISTLFDFKDWPTYVWTPLILFLVSVIPYVLYQWRRTAIRQGYVLSAITETSPIYGDVMDLLENGPRPLIPPIEFEEVDAIEPADFTGYDVVSDHRVYDLRPWTPDVATRRAVNDRANPGPIQANPAQAARMHAKIRFRRTEQASEKRQLRIQLPSPLETMRVEYLPTTLRPAHRRASTGDGPFLYETSLDFADVPVGSDCELVVNQMLPPNMAHEGDGEGHFKFTIAAKTGLVRIWLLLPEGRQHEKFELHRYPIDQPQLVELVKATNTIESPLGSIAAFELINPKNECRYECRWRWRE